MTETFVDEMAIAGGWNPLDWRIEMTKGMDDWQLVLKTLKEKSGFRTDLPKGEGMGVAVVESHGIDRGGLRDRHRQPPRPAHDREDRRRDRSGPCHQPARRDRTVRRLGLLGAVARLDRRARAGRGRFTNTNFDTYNLLRIDQMPEVETHFAMSGGKKWGGLGEPAGPPAPPAVANAIYYATGKRIRSTPFSSHDLSWT